MQAGRSPGMQFIRVFTRCYWTKVLKDRLRRQITHVFTCFSGFSGSPDGSMRSVYTFVYKFFTGLRCSRTVSDYRLYVFLCVLYTYVMLFADFITRQDDLEDQDDLGKIILTGKIIKLCVFWVLTARNGLIFSHNEAKYIKEAF